MTLYRPAVRDVEPCSWLSYREFLNELLQAECVDREERRKIRRVREAAFPRPKRIEDFDYRANPNTAPEVVASLTDPSRVRAGRPRCLDEFGYLDPDRTGSKPMFQIVTAREEPRLIAAASNSPFSEGGRPSPTPDRARPRPTDPPARA